MSLTHVPGKVPLHLHFDEFIFTLDKIRVFANESVSPTCVKVSFCVFDSSVYLLSALGQAEVVKSSQTKNVVPHSKQHKYDDCQPAEPFAFGFFTDIMVELYTNEQVKEKSKIIKAPMADGPP